MTPDKIRPLEGSGPWLESKRAHSQIVNRPPPPTPTRPAKHADHVESTRPSSGPWLHAPSPRAKPGRIRAWLAVLAFVAGLVIGAHVAGKAVQQAAIDAVEWEIGQ